MAKIKVETKPGVRSSTVVVDSRPRFDWGAAVLSSVIAGLIYMLVHMVLANQVMGMDFWAPLRMTAAIVLGQDTMASATLTAGIIIAGIVVLLIASIVYGIIGLGVLQPIHPLTAVVGVGVYGAILYAVNYYGWAQLFLWFVSFRGWPTLVSQIVFGVALGLLYLAFRRTKVYVDVQNQSEVVKS